MFRQAVVLAAIISLAGVALGYCQDKPQGPESHEGQEAAAVSSPYVLSPDDARETARLNDVCRGLLNSHECAQAVERAQLPRYPRLAVREKGRLRLTLKTGRTVLLKDTPGVTGVAYSFRDYLRDLGYFLVHVQLFEGDGYLMINDRTGRRYSIHDLPMVSPDRTRLATLSLDLEAGYNPNAIQIWRLTPAAMSLEWSLSPQDWGPAGGKWLDNATLSLVRQIPQGEYRHTFRQEPLLVKKGAAGWKLEPPGSHGPPQ
jgi:hypothetical protein